MIALMDIDGPVAHFDSHVFALCTERAWPVDATLATQRHRFSTDHVIDRTHRRAAREIIETTRWFADLPVVEGAVDGLHELAEHAEVWLCTKPLEVNPWCRDDKAAWVARHLGEEWVRRLIITPDKSMVVGDVLVDDAPAESWYERAPWRPVIYATPWNGEGSKWEGLPRWSWADGVHRLLDLVADGLGARS